MEAKKDQLNDLKQTNTKCFETYRQTYKSALAATRSKTLCDIYLKNKRNRKPNSKE